MSSLSINRIRVDGGTQTRAGIRPEIVAEYAAENGEMPAIVVFYDGKDYWLADGFHRLEARKINGKGDIECDIRQGTRREAILFSLGANSRHGLRRSNDDKRRAVLVMLEDEEWSKASDRWIAETCAVGPHLVASVRKEKFPQEESDDTTNDEEKPSTARAHSSRSRKGKDGKTRKQPKPREKKLCPRCARIGTPSCPKCIGAFGRAKADEKPEESSADDGEVTPHRCPSCGHKWEGKCVPEMDPLPDFPAGLDTPEFIAAWTNWVNYRRERKLPKYTTRGFNGQMKELMGWGVDRAVKAINHSITKNYNGIYESNKNEGKNGKHISDDEFSRRVMEKIEAAEAKK